MATKNSYIKKITECMKSMRTYRPEFDMMIDTMSEISFLRDQNMKEWKEKGFEQVASYTNKANATNLTKSPYFLNNLQYNEQILKYGKALGLTPSDAQKLGVEVEEDDGLDEFIV